MRSPEYHLVDLRGICPMLELFFSLTSNYQNLRLPWVYMSGPNPDGKTHSNQACIIALLDGANLIVS